jgi:hypothetical protein
MAGFGSWERAIQILDAALGFARSNPIVAVFALVAVLSAVGLLLTLLFRRREDDDFGPLRAGGGLPEPGFGRASSYFDEAGYEGASKGFGRPAKPRRARSARSGPRPAAARGEREGFGFSALVMAFIIGLFVGGGVLAFAGGANFDHAYKTAFRYAKRAIALVSDAKPRAELTKTDDTPLLSSSTSTGSIKKDGDKLPTLETAATVPLGRRTETYVRSIARQLPKRIDEVTSLVSASLQDRAVLLGYAVQQSISEADSGAFADAMRAQIQERTCALSKSSEMRDLNDEGVEFRLVYSDTNGKTLARINLPAGFCKELGAG